LLGVELVAAYPMEWMLLLSLLSLPLVKDQLLDDWSGVSQLLDLVPLPAVSVEGTRRRCLIAWSLGEWPAWSLETPCLVLVSLPVTLLLVLVPALFFPL